MKEFLRYTSHFRRLLQQAMLPLRTELGLSQLELELLLFLHNNPELNTARDAVAYRGFAKSNVSTAVENLEKKGWLSVEPDSESRRVKRLVPRQEREKELQRLSAQQAEVLRGVVSGFTQEEMEQLQALLSRMDQNIIKALGELEGKGHV